MKSKSARLLLLGITALAISVPSALAQRQLGTKKGPTSKLYVAESKGDTQIESGEKVYAAHQATAFDAPGTVIETKADSHDAVVYSNGTGMYVDQNTRVEINKFDQDRFVPTRNTDTEDPMEPSASQSQVHVAHGNVAICTSQLVSGSTMNYSTPEGDVNIRKGKVSITTHDGQTFVDLLEGDVTVQGTGEKNSGGQVLRPGERATIQPGVNGLPPTITIAPIPPEAMPALDDHLSIACNARKTVTFEMIEKAASGGPDGNGTDGEIQPKPTVPDTGTPNVTVSTDRLPDAPK
jgi:hypothetical protein